jgi:hypothetical protein
VFESDQPANGPPCGPGGRGAAAVLRGAAGVLVGLFTLGQIFFLFFYNFLEAEKVPRHFLSESKDADGWLWWLVTRVPGVRDDLDEWLDQGDAKKPEERGKIGRYLAARQKWLDRWYAMKTGQEQGWSLFAPYVADYAGFVSVEFRFDEPETGGRAAQGQPAGGVAAPVILWSDNQPRDVRHFVRFGHFRLRRFESNFEMKLLADKEATRQITLAAWESTIGDKVNKWRDEMLAYLRWRLAQFRREHPGLEPKQVILRAQTFRAPPPPGPTPWDWEEGEVVPVLRWLDPDPDPRKPATLEVYRPSQAHFERL